MSGPELSGRSGGMLSRRALLRGVAVAGSAMGTALLAACGPSVSASPPSATPAAAPTVAQPAATTAPAAVPATAVPIATGAASASQASGQPKRGGALQIMNTADPPDLDPHQSTASVLNTVLVLTYNGLLRYNVAPGNTANSAAAFTVVPDLAATWDNPDPLTYIFHLRQGVKFHDGSEFTADDAAFSLNRIRTKSSEYQRASAFAPVDSVEATDKYTVTVKLSTPYAAFINEVAVAYTRMAPKHAVEQYGDLKRNIVGTGPFKLKEYTRGQRFVFERNPDYYESGIPYLDQIVLTVIPDAATGVAAFQAGQLDVYPTTYQNLQVIKQSVPDLVVGDYQLLSISGIALNVKVKPLDDLRVRQAMWYAINQQEIIDTVFQGDGVKGRVVPPAYAGWAVAFDQLPLNDAPNLDKARQLLAEAGVPNGFTVKCGTTSQYTEPEATVAAQQLKKIGVNLQLNHMEYGAFLDARDKSNFEALAFGLAPFGDIDDFTSALFQTKASRNWGNWSNEGLDALLTQGQKEPDSAKRNSVYAQAQAILAQQNFLIDIPRVNSHMVWHPKVKDFVTAQNPETGLGYYRTWLDR